MDIEDMEMATTAQEWRKQLIKSIRVHSDIVDAIKQTSRIYGPFLILELCLQTVKIAPELTGLCMMVKSAHFWMPIVLVFSLLKVNGIDEFFQGTLIFVRILSIFIIVSGGTEIHESVIIITAVWNFNLILSF